MHLSKKISLKLNYMSCQKKKDIDKKRKADNDEL